MTSHLDLGLSSSHSSAAEEVLRIPAGEERLRKLWEINKEMKNRERRSMESQDYSIVGDVLGTTLSIEMEKNIIHVEKIYCF